jgi:hypothetical protein
MGSIKPRVIYNYVKTLSLSLCVCFLAPGVWKGKGMIEMRDVLKDKNGQSNEEKMFVLSI